MTFLEFSDPVEPMNETIWIKAGSIDAVSIRRNGTGADTYKLLVMLRNGAYIPVFAGSKDECAEFFDMTLKGVDGVQVVR